ncbi:hypothetical protein H0H93_008759 [Arthromyces matolae]|nr:hypothetical protein H0H93_008759 [Arthromyces matolae]
MEAGPSNHNSQSQVDHAQTKSKAHRISSAGVAVMEEFLAHHGAYPTLEQQRDMLSRIRANIPDESYNIRRLKAWFNKRRTTPILLPDPQYPTLTVEAIQHLQTLVAGTPSPSLILISTWAALLKAKPDDVTRWLANKRSPVQHLPTPVSTSPEPASEYQWSFKADPLNSPVIPSPAAPHFCSQHAQPPSHTYALSDRELLEAISDAARSKDSISPHLPGSMEEFQQMFDAYETRIQNIIRQNEASLRP